MYLLANSMAFFFKVIGFIDIIRKMHFTTFKKFSMVLSVEIQIY